MKKLSHAITAAVLAILGFLSAQQLPAATFVISSNSTTAQTLNANGETGTVDAGKSLTVSGGTAAVTMSAITTLTNNGTIQQTGTGRAVRNTAANANLTIFNNGSINAAADDAMKATDSAVNLTISATNGQALDWRDILTKANSITNHSGGSLLATNEDAVRPGVNGMAATLASSPRLQLSQAV